MLHINVALPNGHAELLSLLPSSTVQDLRTKAQRVFGRKSLRLITAKNLVLVDPDKTMEETEIEGALQLWYLNHNWQQQEVPLPCGVIETAPSLRGVIAAMAVTVRKFEIS